MYKFELRWLYRELSPKFVVLCGFTEFCGEFQFIVWISGP